MYNYIVSFLSKKYSYSYLYPYNKEFRRGYKNAWINNIKDYTPWNILFLFLFLFRVQFTLFYISNPYYTDRKEKWDKTQLWFIYLITMFQVVLPQWITKNSLKKYNKLFIYGVWNVKRCKMIKGVKCYNI